MNSSEENSSSESSEEQNSSQAYRLVPIDEEQTYKYERISFRDLLRFYRDKRAIVYWCTGVFFAIGLVFAFFSQAEYQTSASIIPEYELQDKVNEVIENFGLILGFTGSIEKERSPSGLLEQYPYMISSVSFQKRLMYKSFYYGEVDSTITLYEYFTKIYAPSPLQALYKYTFGFPATIGSGLQSKTQPTPAENFSSQDTSYQIIHLNSDEKKVLNQLSNRITADYERRAGIIRIQTQMPEPLLAAKLAQLTLRVLQETASEYKSRKARLYKNFLTQQLDQAQTDLEKARATLIDFKNAESQPLDERMALQSRYNSTLDRYNTISRLLERVELTIKEQLPTFRILDDITIPHQHSQPKRVIILTLSLLLGFFVAICWITVVFFASTLKDESPDS